MNKAAEYSRAHTASDIIITKAMPKIIQVKNFGFTRHSMEYKGLAAEDITENPSSYIPIVVRKTTKVKIIVKTYSTNVFLSSLYGSCPK